MTNKIYLFRKALAEKGIELTPEEAKNAYAMGRRLIKKSRNMSMQDIWNMQEVEIEGMTPEQINDLINLYKCAKDL